MKFREDGGAFDVDAYIHGCEIFITAQEILVSNASYPTAKIAVNSEDFRPLGLGYCNLGALLMAQGTGLRFRRRPHFSRRSDRDYDRRGLSSIGENRGNIVGPFNGYAEQPRTDAARHRQTPRRRGPYRALDCARRLDQRRASRVGRSLAARPEARLSQRANHGFGADRHHCVYDGRRHDRHRTGHRAGEIQEAGRRRLAENRQPDGARSACANWVTTSDETDAIVEYIDKNDTIEGAPALRDDDLNVFDCAFKAMNGTRSIHYMGHVKMMAAAQPFLSGAISKTVNMPQDCTVDEIMQTPTSKAGKWASKPWRFTATAASARSRFRLRATRRKSATSKKPKCARAMRRKLPDERNSITHKFSIAGQEGYFTVGLYEDGSPGEIFIKMIKEGSTISGLMDSLRGRGFDCACNTACRCAFWSTSSAHTRFEPSGYTTNKDIPIAKSLMDYIFRWFDLKFHPNGDNGHIGKPAHAGSIAAPAQATLMASPGDGGDDHGHGGHQTQSDAPPCSECGTIMIRAGACYKCPNCGTTSGCG